MSQVPDPDLALIAAIEEEIVRLEQSKSLVEANLLWEVKGSLPDCAQRNPSYQKLCRQYGLDRKRI